MLKLVLILIAAFAIIACGGNDSDEIVGIWKGIYDGEVGILTFHNNGECTLNAEGETFYGTYLVHGNLLEVNYKGEIMVVSFSTNGNLMTLGATYDGEQHTVLLERGL